MTRVLLCAFLLAPASAFAQVEKTGDVRVSAAPLTGPGALTAAPAPLSLSVPSLSAAPSAAPALAASALAAPVAAPAAAPAAAPVSAPAAAAVLPRAQAAKAIRSLAERLAAPAAAPDARVDEGRTLFDGGLTRTDAPALTAGAAAADGTRLARSAERAAAPAPKIPLKQRFGEIAELGVMALGFQLLTGLGVLWFGAHATFPAAAGALWVLAGTELVKQLGNLRSVVVGGWQASHDQKYRVDPSTGRLKDIRGRKYGEDRYEKYAPGPVSARERRVTEAMAVALGLPWVLPAGLQAVLLYAGGAAAALALRRLWRGRRPRPVPVERPKDFEYDR